MKTSLPLLLLAAFLLPVFSGCTTLANRRDLYFPQQVDGPYTRMLREGIPQREVQSATEGTTTSDFKNVR